MSGIYKLISKQYTSLCRIAKNEPVTIVFILSLVVLILFWTRHVLVLGDIEGFDDGEVFKDKFDMRRTFAEIYDTFYVSICDKLVMNDIKNTYELKHLNSISSLGGNSVVLDIGSGTGHHVGALTKEGVDTTGIDISEAMVEFSKGKYPDAKYICGDIQESNLFNPGSFTHITCLYFTIYCMNGADGIKNMMKNCYQWISSGGYMMIHLVDRDKFDPILPAGSPFVMVPPQTFAKKRVTDTSVKFEKFQYTANYETTNDPNVAIFKETFIDDKTQNVRKHELTVHMLPSQEIVAMMKDVGFEVKGKQHMGEIGYDYQYLYSFQKK
jgi:SAM-dependent methyltransferase